MLESIAASATADIFAWAVIGALGTILTLVASTFRNVRKMDRILLGEDSVDADKGVVGKVRELDERVERIEQRPPRNGNDRAD